MHLPSRIASVAHRIGQEHDFSFPTPVLEGQRHEHLRHPHKEKGSLVTRIAELEETPVLTLVDTAERSEAEISEMPDPLIQALDEMPDPLIQALVKKLPRPNSIWSLEDRAKWLRAAAIIFNLVYKPGETDSKTEDMPSVLKSAG